MEATPSNRSSNYAWPPVANSLVSLGATDAVDSAPLSQAVNTSKIRRTTQKDLVERARPAIVDPSNLPVGDASQFAGRSTQWRFIYDTGRERWIELQNHLKNPQILPFNADELKPRGPWEYFEKEESQMPDLARDLCTASGLLGILDAELHSQFEPDNLLCSPTYQETSLHTTSVGGLRLDGKFLSYASSSAQAIIAGHQGMGRREIRDFFVDWQDLAGLAWSNKCVHDEVEASTLKYLIYPNYHKNLVWDSRVALWRHLIAANTNPDALVNGERPRESDHPQITYSPTDADFYAILGLSGLHCLTAFLVQHALLLATYEEANIVKVKTIDQIKVATHFGELFTHQLQRLDVVYVLKDIDPPPGFAMPSTVGGRS